MTVDGLKVEDGSMTISAIPVIALTVTLDTPSTLMTFCSTDLEQLEQSIPVTRIRIVDLDPSPTIEDADAEE
jgi:hypothetical protein